MSSSFFVISVVSTIILASLLGGFSINLYSSGNSQQCYANNCSRFTNVHITWCPPWVNDTSCFLWLYSSAYEAERNNWTLMSNDCYNGGSFYGYRYSMPGVTGIFILYDNAGYICGIQTNMPFSALQNCTGNYTGNYTYNYSATPFITNVTCDNSTNSTYCARQTAYFVDPKTICCDGRSFSEYQEYGLGDGVFLQKSSPFDVERVIYSPNSPVSSGNCNWTQCQCYDGMGVHYFCNVSQWNSTNCTQVPPYGIITERSNCTRGFVFMLFGTITGRQVEHLGMDAAGVFEPAGSNSTNVTSCIQNAIGHCGMTTMHVYVTDNPQNFNCPS